MDKNSKGEFGFTRYETLLYFYDKNEFRLYNFHEYNYIDLKIPKIEVLLKFKYFIPSYIYMVS